MKYKAVLYDLGDIFFEAHLWRKWNWEELTRLGYFSRNFPEFYDLYDSFLSRIYKSGDVETYEQAFDRFLKHLSFIDNREFTARSFAKKKEFEENRALYDGVRETLEELYTAGIKNVILTDNEATEAQVRTGVIARYDINRFIDHVVTSRDVGATKPDPKIFHAALERLQLTVEEVCFVGHDQDELEGAHAVGMTTVEFNNYLGRSVRCDHTIRSFPELRKIV